MEKCEEKCEFCNVELDNMGDPDGMWSDLALEDVSAQAFVRIEGSDVRIPVNCGFRFSVEIFRSASVPWELSIGMGSETDGEAPIEFPDSTDSDHRHLWISIPIRYCPKCGRELPRP